MTDITNNNKVIVYADDTTVLITGRNLTEAKQHCNDILERFFLYFTLNKLWSESRSIGHFSSAIFHFFWVDSLIEVFW